MPVVIAALILFGCYLIGSLSLAYWCGRINGIDIRKHGSGNLGATNAARVLGKHYFFIVFSGDVLKGLLPVLLLQHYTAALCDWQDYQLLPQLLPVLAALACVIGHNFTIYHGFKGGKAVATTLGAVLALAPVSAAGGFGVWVVVWLLVGSLQQIKRSDAVGPASIVAMVSAPVIHCLYYEQPFSMPLLASTLLIILLAVLALYRHRSNAVKFIKQMNGSWDETTQPTDSAHS